MEVLTPSQKGAVSEAAITAAAIELGYTVLRPLCEGRRYDLVIDLEPRLLRVQCKLARLIDDVLSVGLQSTRLTPSGYRHTSYRVGEVDAVGAYSPRLRSAYLLPIEVVCGRRALHLRLAPARNGQRQRINWAPDYELGAMLAAMRSHQSGG